MYLIMFLHKMSGSTYQIISSIFICIGINAPITDINHDFIIRLISVMTTYIIIKIVCLSVRNPLPVILESHAIPHQNVLCKTK